MSSAQRLGTVIGGRYRLDALLGEGGMGVVYRAFDVRLERAVALKLVRAELVGSSPSLLERFEREARAAARLSAHPNIVTIFEDGRTSEGVPYIALELLDGTSLAALIQREGRLSPARARELLVPAMEGIAFAHQLGIVHRDLKPENIFIHTDARGAQVPKVVDFGIARLEGSNGPTQAGQALGTVMYMSPEQLSGRDIGPWCDVWALGVVWYQCLTQSLPFPTSPDEATFALVAKILVDAPRPIRELRPDLPPALANVIDRALSRDISARPRDAAALLVAFNEAFGGRSAFAPTEIAMTATDPSRSTPAAHVYAPLVSQSMPTPVAPTPQQSGFRPLVIALVLSAALLGPLLGVGAYFVFARSEAQTPLGERVAAPAPPMAVPMQPVVPLAPAAPAPTEPVLAHSHDEDEPTAEPTRTVRVSWTWPPDHEQTWTGQWVDGSYRYRFLLRLARNGGAVDGRFEWARMDVVGETGVEWVRGTYDEASRQLVVGGYRVTGAVAREQYRITIGPAGGLIGTSQTEDRDWSGQLTARPID